MGKEDQKDRRSISRREFLRLSAIFSASAGLAACGGTPPAPVAAPTAAAPTSAPAPTEAPAPTSAAAPTAAAAATEAPAAAPTKFKEAPMLADLVQAGKLPPVDERLPKNPVVVDSREGIGNYGGTLRRGYSGVSDYWGLNKVQQVSLVWFTPDLAFRPDLAESWEINDDASEWTFHLREGMKWSDGTDFTSADFVWFAENVLNNEAVSAANRSGFFTGKNVVMKVAAPDANTVVMTFADPNPMFLFAVTRGQPFVPIEYMKQYHVDFTDKATLEAKAKEAGFDTWDALFNQAIQPLRYDRPSVGIWVQSTDNPIGDQLVTLTRNPYFAQVDSDGNQLPYTDKVSFQLFEAPDALVSRIIAGEIDYQARHMSIGNFTLYKENEDKGDYHVNLLVSASHVGLNPNHTSKNPNLREFFQTRDVRIAMSHAINRDEMNELIFNGTAVPRQYSPLVESPQYYEKAANAYIEFDVDKANQLLDAAGYDKKDADGFRLWKDGSDTLSFTIEGIFQTGDPFEDAAQTFVKYLGAVGIKSAYKAIERSLYTEHFNANEIDAGFWGGDRTVLPLAAPIIWIGTQPDRPWSVAWGLFRTNPSDPNAEEPPADHFIRKIWDLWDQTSLEPDEAKRNELFRGILDIWAEEVPMVTALGEVPQPLIVKNGLKGVPESFPWDDPTKDEHLINTQTLYWDDPAKHA